MKNPYSTIFIIFLISLWIILPPIKNNNDDIHGNVDHAYVIVDDSVFSNNTLYEITLKSTPDVGCLYIPAMESITCYQKGDGKLVPGKYNYNFIKETYKENNHD